MRAPPRRRGAGGGGRQLYHQTGRKKRAAWLAWGFKPMIAAEEKSECARGAHQLSLSHARSKTVVRSNMAGWPTPS